MVSPFDPQRYEGPNKFVPFIVARTFDPGTDPALSLPNPWNNSTYKRDTNAEPYKFGKEGTTFWINKSTGRLWYLGGYLSFTGNAIWIPLSGGGNPPIPPVLSIQTDLQTVAGTVQPDGGGTINATGVAPFIAQGTGQPVRTDKTSGNTMAVRVQIANALGAGDSSKVGMSNFNIAQFAVSNLGFVTLKGGTNPPVIGVVGDDAQEVVANGSGDILWTGKVVTNQANANRPVYFKKNGTNTEELDVQLSTAIAATDATRVNVGLSVYNSAQFIVDANGWVSLANPNPQVGTGNIGMNLSGGTLKIWAANGTNWTASNVGFVTLPHPTLFSQLVTIPLDNTFSNFTITDSSGSNQLDAATWGVTDSAAWATDMPIFVYAVISTSATDVAFALSRVPNRTVAPVAGNIAAVGSATNASTQGSFFLMQKNGVTPTPGNFASNPCVCIGSLRIQKTSGTRTWVFQALTASDGINQFQDTKVFTYPTLQNGATPDAAAGPSHFINNNVPANRSPVWGSPSASYTMSKNGLVYYSLLYGNLTADGAGAIVWKVTIPLSIGIGSNAVVGWANTVAGGNQYILAWTINTGANFAQFEANQATNGSLLQGQITGSPNIAAQFSLTTNFFASIG